MLYFGYSLRDELRLQCPPYSIGARAGMVRFNEAHDNGDRVMKKFLLADGWSNGLGHGRSRVGC